jgi:hypothetical protein
MNISTELETPAYELADMPRADFMNFTIQPLAQRSMFWRPTYLAQSAWLEHIPFAFWLTEAHRPRVLVELGVHFGSSYFAFCQAVQRLDLGTRCFAIDTFKGDEHAGNYDEAVIEQVRAHNAAQYSGFSRVIRSTFDDALKHFADGEIDLLHIDGLHTFEAVRHDFHAWLPKLSRRAVVIMHDTNVRERDFGVHRLFDTLKKQYSHFEFVHGHGLGVLGVGPEQSDVLRRLFDASTDDHTRQLVREIFSRLGQGCADAYAATMPAAKLSIHGGGAHDRLLDKLQHSLDKTNVELESNRRELVQRLANDNERMTRTLARRDAMIVRLRAASRASAGEAARLCKELHAREDTKLDARIKHVESQNPRLEKENQALKNLLQEADALRAGHREKDSAIAAEQRRAGKLEAELKARTEALKANEALLAGEMARAAVIQAEMQSKTNSLKTLEKRLADAEAQTNAAIAHLNAAVAQKDTAMAERKVALAKLDSEMKKANGERDAQSRRLEDRFKELTALTLMIEERDRELAARNSEIEAARVSSAHEKQTVAAVRPMKKAKRETLSVAAQIALLQKSGLFDRSWYLRQYPDVARSGSDPVEHYVLHGAGEGRNPAPGFDTGWYLASYSDVSEAQLNPLLHYIRHGKKEGRAANSLAKRAA